MFVKVKKRFKKEVNKPLKSLTTMFSEDIPENNLNKGWIEVITGPMFSGKTEELIRRIEHAKLANQKIEIFKPKIDKRYSETEIVSHNLNSIHSTPIETSANILLLVTNADIVAFDEAQFFDNGLIEVCNTLANNGIRVIVAGLDMDYKGNPFGPIPHLMACAEYVTKLQAICINCGNLAYISHRKSDNSNLVLIGEKAEYEPLCRVCFNKTQTQK